MNAVHALGKNVLDSIGNTPLIKLRSPASAPHVDIYLKLEFALDETLKLIQNFTHYTLVEILGGVESLIHHPATVTRSSIPSVKRMRMGITDGLIRFSVGIEDPKDLVDDVKQQLDAASRICAAAP